MIALILGGAPSVWLDLENAQAQLGKRKHIVVAANLAGLEYDHPLAGWASLHPDNLGEWVSRKGGTSARLFAPAAHAACPDAEIVGERWPGSSGLYALQCALLELGATAAILCGVPMDTMAGHFSNPGAWAGTDDYRQAFAAALPEIGGRVRSMGGWTADLFGKPTAAWVGAIDNTRPAGVSAAPNARNDVMKHVKNGSEATLSFWHNQPDGLRGRIHLDPGQAGDFDVDPDASEFARDGVTVTTPRAPAAPKAKTKRSAPKKPAPRKAAAPKPQEPAPPAPPVADAT